MKKIEINNFRSIEKAIMNFGEINFFIGDNNTGKSSTLKLIEALMQNSHLNFQNTFLYSEQIENLKYNIKEPLEVLYKVNFESEKQKEKNEIIENFEYLKIDSINNFDYPLIKTLIVPFFDEDFNNNEQKKFEFVKFDIDYEFKDYRPVIKQLDISIKYLSLIEYKNIIKKLKIKNLLNLDFEIKKSINFDVNQKNTKSKKDFYFYSINFLTRILNNSNKSVEFRIDILFDIYQLIKKENSTKIKEVHGLSRIFGTKKTKYIDPLRPILKDIYFKNEIDKEEKLQFVRKLNVNNSDLRIISKFLKKSKMLENLDIAKIKAKEFSSEAYKLSYKKYNKQNIPISISGTGISQIIPILFAILEKRNDKIFIEQPEVHLHPRAQAEFGTFISDYINNYSQKSTFKNNKILLKKQFFIETHSLYMINRFRNEIKNNKLCDDNSRITFFKNTSKKTIIESIKFNEFGEFDGKIDNFLKFFVDENIKNLS
ncbi:unknown protein [Mesoplasma florum L1]|uniref:Endonuclease GajA/Old nuclease/RecF-like AAA domain-containing protein n=1 Tax=Mesoplasma florum (strain ATCC 33453 / NBRC 100688 / NCTC 11704 / L1) TaxID=265311 RepID=Q6F1H0_MESFL|nr:AAA family ATPase [Mesoplasma florum]AAT75653.1 unknown protein [Mesoplasma florum L1]